MRTIDNLSVGCKIGTEHVSFNCRIDVPDTAADCKKLSRNSEAFHAQMFERGWRIWKQEQTGARDVVRNATVKEREAPDFVQKIQAVIDAADPLTPPKRTGRPSAPKEVKVTNEVASAMKKGDTVALAALLAAQGIKISFQK